MEQGAWTRRPGTQHASTTRGGAPGRVINFDFKQSSPYSMEFTAGFLRFRAGPTLVTRNNPPAVVSISAANPAKVATTPAHGWTTGNSVVFRDLEANNPLLQNRVFTITVTSATEFTLTDAVTGATIDGATLGAFVSGSVAAVRELATPYTGDLWSSLRAIQADIPTKNSTTPGAVLLQPTVQPYVLQVTSPPTATTTAIFSLAAANFKDGPYFDPVPGGTLATPSALIGNVNITLSFNAYDAARSYAIGDYVTSVGVNYKSLTDANLNHLPPNATHWVPVEADDAVGPNGFQGSDIGRMIRLFSEPPFWAVATAYVVGNVVAYGGTYYKALANSTGVTPDTAPATWALFPTGAIWTWGKIISLLNEIDRALAGSVNIGDLTANGGLAASFDGNSNQSSAACSASNALSVAIATRFIGKNYSGASAQAIGSATIFPSSDWGFTQPAFFGQVPTVTINLRGKATAPASASDGTLLGTSGAFPNSSSPVTITSNNLITTWNYVWFEIIGDASSYGGLLAFIYSAECKFFNPPGSGTASGVVVQILGDALLYTTPVRVWRLGLYSSTTTWPVCGTYHEGRLWLSGAVANRIDSSKSDNPFNFAPTETNGVVSPNNAISYTFNSPDVNPIFWMEPDYHGIVCGTQGGEWLVQATTQNLPLTPTTIQAHRYTTYKCANIVPARTDMTLAMVQNLKRDLLEYYAEVYSGKFVADDLADTARHLVVTGLQEIAWQQEIVPTIWARCGNGSLIGMTYLRKSLTSVAPPITGWHRHTLGSGRTVESICVAASADGTLDALTAVTNDASGVRHVEMMTKVFDETDDLANAWFLDDAVRPSSTTTSNVTPAPFGGLTINGLWHLNGKTVQVFAAGLDCGQGEYLTPISDFVVSNGSITVPYGDSISAGPGGGLFTAVFAAAAVAAGQVVIGFTYDSDGQIVRPALPAESGARSGPAFGKTRRTQRYGIQVIKTAGLSIGTTFAKLDPIPFKSENGSGPRLAPGQTFTGIYRDSLTDDYSLESMLAWRVSRPLPAMIAAIGGFVHTQDL
jgi:hypothetical protein